MPKVKNEVKRFLATHRARETRNRFGGSGKIEGSSFGCEAKGSKDVNGARGWWRRGRARVVKQNPKTQLRFLFRFLLTPRCSCLSYRLENARVRDRCTMNNKCYRNQRKKEKRLFISLFYLAAFFLSLPLPKPQQQPQQQKPRSWQPARRAPPRRRARTHLSRSGRFSPMPRRRACRFCYFVICFVRK